MENKTDIRGYSDDELIFIVFNGVLYNIRHDRDLVGVLDEYYIYTTEQLEVLKQDLADDLN